MPLHMSNPESFKLPRGLKWVFLGGLVGALLDSADAASGARVAAAAALRAASWAGCDRMVVGTLPGRGVPERIGAKVVEVATGRYAATAGVANLPGVPPDSRAAALARTLVEELGKRPSAPN